MLPPFLPGYLIPADIDLTAAFAPLVTGLGVIVIILALGLAVYAWGCYLINAPLAKAVYPRHLVCPLSREPVEARITAWKGQPWDVLDVEHCSGWRVGKEKRCHKECVCLSNSPAPPPLSLVV